MYIDPGSGGMLFQILAVLFGLLSGSVLIFSSKIKMGFARLRRFFRKSSDENNDNSLEEMPK